MDYLSYAKLTTASSIRLLDLMPGRGNDEIFCQLRQADLRSEPEYEAISYVWGDANMTQNITCGGCSCKVTTNLFHALQRFRRPDRSRYLWADALCINQGDIDERSQQVAIMKQIYERAGKVLIWLGPDSDNNVASAKAITRLVSEEICRASNMTLSALSILSTETLDDALLAAEKDRLPAGNSNSWISLAWVFSKVWFKRIWVVQEAVSAQSISVLCGDGEFDWDELGLTACWVQKQVMRSDYADFEMFEGTSVFEASELYDRDSLQKSDWIELLHAYRSLGATDPRDKVYALYGLTPFARLFEISTSLSPDYEKSKVEVYTMVVETAFRCYNNLRILSYVQHGETLARDWPTWVPAWDTSLDVSGLDSHVEGFAFSASRGVELGSYGGDWKIQRGVLRLRGIQFDAVDVIGDMMTMEHFHLSQHTAQSSHPIVQFFTRALNQSWGIAQSQRLEQLAALCFGLLAGHNMDHDWANFPAENTDQHLADFAAYMVTLLGPTESVKDLCQVLDPDGPGNALRYEVAASRVCDQRRLFITANGLIGIGPAAMRSNDRVCIMFGGQQPVILRDIGAQYQFVGESYLYDIMFGEALSDYENGKQANEVFNLC